MNIWRCPDCEGGIRAPSRMKRNDVRRYCLTCSESTGFLVERTAPALDKVRAIKKQRRTAKRRRTAAQANAAGVVRHSFNGVDMRSVLFSILRLEVYKRYSRFRSVPKFVFRKSKSKPYTSGTAWPGLNRFVITAGRDQEPCEVIEVMLHEVAHLLCHPKVGHTGEYPIRYCALVGEWNANANEGKHPFGKVIPSSRYWK